MAPSKSSPKLPQPAQPPQSAQPYTAIPADDPCASAASSEVPPKLPSLWTNPDIIQSYKTLYDVLGRAYWEASDITSKDTIQGARDAIYEILTELNITTLEENTALFLALKTRIQNSNQVLEEIREKINTITKNLATASSVIAAIAKVTSIASTLL